MKIGMLGLGKLGLPCALAMESRGHELAGWDVDESRRSFVLRRGTLPYEEQGVTELLKQSKMICIPPEEMKQWADIVFVAVQTPHEGRFEGCDELPERRADFYYGFLRDAVRSVDGAKLISVISTVLPGTMEREILPGIDSPVAYNPFFIAMGTVIHDFLNPEFTLLGICCEACREAFAPIFEFYKTIHDKPVFQTDIRTAELIKVVYNTFISTKIGFINFVMELCEKLRANVDHVSDALALATDRLISDKYLRGGMGDGGGCHPRDNIAMSWLSRRLDMSWDWCGAVMLARQEQARWIAREAAREGALRQMPVFVLGTEFKAETKIETGSAALLLMELLRKAHTIVVAVVEVTVPGVYIIGCNHARYRDAKFPEGSVVIDPWGYIPDQPGVKVRRLGRP